MYVYQIEISNYCSLKCAYCPHKKQMRPKGFMSFDTFKKCVELFKMSNNKGKMYLHNFGEPLLHPDICEFIKYANQEGIECSCFTSGIGNNGVPFSREVYMKLRKSGMRIIDFSAHAMTVQQFQTQIDGVLSLGNCFIPNKENLGNWGGQIDGIICPRDNRDCIFERKNCLVVLWDGTIASCCIDVEGSPRIQHIDDILGGEKYKFKKIPLCKTCSAMRDDEEL